MTVIHPDPSNVIHRKSKFIDTLSKLLCFCWGEACITKKGYVVHIEDKEANWPVDKSRRGLETGFCRFGSRLVVDLGNDHFAVGPVAG
jgi:hypothetical protein